MLGGEFKHSLDAKNRIFVPAKLRDDLGETFVVAKDIRSKCLKVFSMSGWDNYIAPIRQQNRALAEKAIRYLHASLAQVSPDAQGRITIPQELVEYANITKVAVVIGCYDYAEIWSEENYESNKKDMDTDMMLSELESLGL